MPTHDTQPAGFQPPATAPKVSPYAPRPFEVVESGQTSTNPFARRPHEVWTAEPPSSPTAPPEVQDQEEPQGVGTFWTEFRMNAPGTPPLPPPNLGRSGSVPAVQREPVTPEPYWYQGPPAQAMAAPVQESSTAAPSVSGPLIQQQANGETETVPEPPGIGTFWTEFRMNAPGTPPMPPPNLGRLDRGPAIQRDPITPEPYWYQGPPVQAKLTVGAPNDAYEQEADRVAAQVMTMPDPASSLQRQEAPDIEEAEEIPGLQTRAIADSITPLVQRQTEVPEEDLVQPKCEACEPEESIQRQSDAGTQAPADLESRLDASRGGGSALPEDVRSFMEPRFGADFSQVRVHTGSNAVQMNREVGAKAFTHKQDIYFNAGHYSPGSASGKELLAHELTHTIQQTGGIHRKSKQLQRKLDPAAEMGSLEAKAIAQTIAPFNRSSLQRQSATPEAEPETETLLQAKTLSQTPISFLNRAAQPDLTAEEEPDLQAKSLPEQALSVQTQASSLDGKSIQTKALVTSTGAPQVQRGLWDTVKSGARSVASGVSNVAEGVSDTVSGGLDAIRQRLLQPVAQLASRMPGYPLLTVILGRDPVTGAAVERNATNLIQGILSFVPGGDQMFRNLQESRALENAFHWLSEQVTRLNLTWDAIRGLFQRTWESLSAGDLLNPGAAFERIRNIFAEPVQRIRNFASAVGQKILEFVFEGAIRLAGGSADQVMGIIRRAGGVFTNIIRDPIAFVGNLVQAVKGGFQSFAGNILTHLRSGLMGWLFGALAGAGLQMPQSFDLRGIVSIVLQVIGATYQRLRGMLARRIGEQRVARLEQAFSFLQTLATEGLAGAWQQIMEFAGNLQEMVIGGIREWVMSSIVQAAVTRLVSMFNPAGAVIQAAIAVYNTVMFFVERAQQIAALANSVFESIGRIASGNIGGAIAYVEQAMARSLPVIISFMARLLGLGNVSGQIRNIIGRVQGAVERAIDRLVGWITTRARSLLGRGQSTGTASAQGESAAGAQGAIDAEVRFQDRTGESHRMWLQKTGTRYQLMVASNHPSPVENAVKNGGEFADVDGAQETQVATKAGEVEQLANGASQTNRNTLVAQVRSKMGEIKSILEQSEGSEIPETQVTHQPMGNKAGSVTAAPLTNKPGNTRGSSPGANMAGWSHVVLIDRELLNPKTAQWGPAYWVKMHLLSQELHGPGEFWNLVPARKTDNSTMERGPERDAKTRIANNEILYYEVKVIKYHDGEILENFPKNLSVEWGKMRKNGTNHVRESQLGSLPIELEKPPLDPSEAAKIDLKTAGRDTLISIGLKSRLARNIQEERVKGGAFKDEGNFKQRMQQCYSEQIPPVDFMQAHWPSIESLIRSGSARF